MNQDEQDYHVKLDVFEGPLDLLLYLIKKEEVEITDIPIEKICVQYNEYLKLMRMLDLNIAGEFLVMSATLMLIKSRMLLPVEERPDLEEDEEDPRLDLVRQLVEYKKFKDAAGILEELEEGQHNVFFPEEEHVALGKDPGLSLRDVSIFDLLSSFSEILKRSEKEELTEIFAERYTVADKVDFLMNEVVRKGRKQSMHGLFKGMRSRSEMVCTFLAILELIRLKQIRAAQDSGEFSDIVLLKAEDDDEEFENDEMTMDEVMKEKAVGDEVVGGKAHE
ncbi:MAG: segregation/condensation protein A [Verrucomicrobia bacterium]|nr:segregation/condensation protein A [Verrucomicrobiota bacterium]MCH8511577.1 segregation/condensation protein A [Kiritimatiellia bacterium]